MPSEEYLDIDKVLESLPSSHPSTARRFIPLEVAAVCHSTTTRRAQGLAFSMMGPKATIVFGTTLSASI